MFVSRTALRQRPVLRTSLNQTLRPLHAHSLHHGLRFLLLAMEAVKHFDRSIINLFFPTYMVSINLPDDSVRDEKTVLVPRMVRRARANELDDD
jgi:hypothetical protein